MTATNPYQAQLAWIDDQRDRMIQLVEQWAAINSGTHNLSGLAQLTDRLSQAFGILGPDRRLVELSPANQIDSKGLVCSIPLGHAIHITQRPQAPLRVFLGIHMDTVYGEQHPFQTVRQLDDNTLNGPGVADAKGGLAIMLIALEALERSGLAESLGWEVVINSDEEIGSPGSSTLLAACAKRNHLGLVFEPALADGTLAAARGGSGNFTVVLRGNAAHAGRQFHLGRNAIDALAELIGELSGLNGKIEGATVNVGKVEGGGPVNIVPDLAIGRFNVRIQNTAIQHQIDEQVNEIIAKVQLRDGITIERHGGWGSPPKPMNDTTLKLFEHVATCGHDLGLSILWRPTGGVCDGNKLAGNGLPTVDTMGPRGGQIHSDGEFLLLDSLTERAKLCALLLMRLATGDLSWTSDRI